jgi:Clp amino terminal domain, pathogenicity island component
MFERYTEKARRLIFFARYEASQLGSPYIETEHLLLGLLREDKALANSCFPSYATIEAIRKKIEQHSAPHEKISTSVDLPLSQECKRVLGYGAQEADQMQHRHIETVHLLLGLFREEQSFAAQLLRGHGLQIGQVREEALRSNPASGEAPAYRPEWPKALSEILRTWEQTGGITVATGATIAGHAPDFAIYAGAKGPVPLTSTPEEEVKNLQIRLKSIIRGMEHATANHEFEQARLYSNEERTARELLRHLCEKHNLGPTDDVLTGTLPFLCIEIVREDRFSNMRTRFEDYISAGVAHVWALDFSAARAYTVTAATG